MSLVTHKTAQRLRGIALAPAAVVCGLAALWPGASAEAQQPRSLEATRTACNVCHRDKFESTARSPHTVLDREAWQERTGVGLSCLACHGDVSEHIRAPGRAPVFTFSDESAVQQTEVCMDCHQDTHPRFDSSPHARAGITCTQCHSQHDAPQAQSLLRSPATGPPGDGLGPASAICRDCHGGVLAAFELNERHRLHDGALECTSCHDPHAPAPRRMLGAFKQQACTDCHEDKGGPFVFEHPASRVEGCTSCHTPHGSPNRHLLEHQRVGELCLSCHATVPQFHFGFNPAAPPRFGLDTQCTNCHSSIHGSNFDPHFLR